jgi:hypothetical protein
MGSYPTVASHSRTLFSRPSLNSICPSASVISLYTSISIQRLQDELNSRTLRNDGKKEDLVRRLKEAGWDEDCGSTNFSSVSSIPNRDSTKDMGIPAPRPSTFERLLRCIRPQQAFQPSETKVPNPVTLTTCLISCEVALSRYRPVFEYSTFYADLRGGDLINLGYYNNQLDTDMIWSSESTEVIADLEQITQIILHLKYLRSYIPG